MKNNITKSKSFVFVLSFMLCSNFVFSQENTKELKKTYSLSLGYEKSYFKDINYSPLNQNGNGAVLQFQYEKQLKNNNLFSFGLDLPFAITQPKIANHFKAIQTIANIEVAYLKKLPVKNNKLQLFAGAQYHTYYHLVFYDGTEAFTMFGVNGLDASAKLYYQLNEKQKIHIKASLPVLAQLVRPPYSGWDKFITDNPGKIPKILTRGKITSLNKFFGVNFDLNYEYQYKTKRSLWLNYGLRYYTTNEVKKSIVLNNQINVGINFKL